MTKFVPPIIFSDVTIESGDEVEHVTLCSECGELYKNSEERILICFKCHREICDVCVDGVLCPPCQQEKRERDGA